MSTMTATNAVVRGSLSVSEVAAESGAAPSAIRFYEKHGVVTAERTAGNQRRFHESAICRVHVARLAQRVGLTVREIADLFATLPTDPGPDDWERVAGRLVAEAEQRVTKLTRQLDSLATDGKLCEL